MKRPWGSQRDTRNESGRVCYHQFLQGLYSCEINSNLIFNCLSTSIVYLLPLLGRKLCRGILYVRSNLVVVGLKPIKKRAELDSSTVDKYLKSITR